jgi:hypothetical protein
MAARNGTTSAAKAHERVDKLTEVVYQIRDELKEKLSAMDKKFTITIIILAVAMQSPETFLWKIFAVAFRGG